MSATLSLLELNDVRKQYVSPDSSDAVEVLGGVDLTIQAGESLAIIGPSGSGKSTLLNIIGALDTPSTGKVILDGQDLSQLAEKQLAQLRNQMIGFVFQRHHLLPQCTVLENVLIPTLAVKRGGTQNTAEERAYELLERVGLRHRLSHRPGQLSGGECQRVAVVRALINEPKLLLADEPTGSLDAESAHELTHLLTELNQEVGIALLVVTHALTVAREMQRILQLASGKLVEISHSNELLDSSQT